MRRDPLVEIELQPGRFVKMHKRDAIAKGLLEPDRPKVRQPPEDKARRPPEDKIITSEAFKARQEPEPEPEPDPDDFSEIAGVGPATAEELQELGYRTFDDLRAASLDDLPWRARGPIEEWRE